ncbi:MAG: hypothetical protein O8C56_01440 [Candidatus Methanoperedens sp.]|nr:hypothetical protein [Candidatus Methanoperedens sp.]
MDTNKHCIEAVRVLNENEPQINAPSRASGGRIHVNRCASWRRLHVWLLHTWRYVSMHNGGHDADERRFNEAVSIEKGC